VIVAGTLGAVAVATDTMGAGHLFDRAVHRVALILDPPPDRPTAETVEVTPRPSHSPTPTPSLKAGATPIPTPARKPVDVQIVRDSKAAFASEERKDWCAPAGLQMVLTILGHGDTTPRLQAEIAGRVGEWEAYSDSKDGEWGPSAMVLALSAYDVKGYQVRAYGTMDDALFDASVALTNTHSPVIIIAWKGAHTWVMTGFKATADPAVFDDAKITGAYILDPWYPRVSTIWPRSLPAGSFHDIPGMRENFVPWQRPEGIYPGRDGKFLLVIPTKAATPVL
jgi:hypothetical protein